MPPLADGARDLAARAAYEVGTIVGRWPALALPIARWRGHGEPFDESTELVVEGFPRSSNTLAVALLSEAQPGGLRVAHHVHAPAHVLAAVDRGLPTLVMIREPEEAVVELVLRKPALTVAQVLRGWIRFYRPLLARRAGFVVARSVEVPAGLAGVVRRLNERFGTDLSGPDVGPEALARAEEAMGRYWWGRSGPGLPLVGRSPAGDELDEEDAPARRALVRGYGSPRLASLRSGAARLHETFTDDLPDLG